MNKKKSKLHWGFRSTLVHGMDCLIYSKAFLRNISDDVFTHCLISHFLPSFTKRRFLNGSQEALLFVNVKTKITTTKKTTTKKNLSKHKRNKTWAGVMDQSVECLQHRHEGLSSVPSIYKACHGVMWNVCKPCISALEKQRSTRLGGSQSSPICSVRDGSY